jgi:hypothetical protein
MIARSLWMDILMDRGRVVLVEVWGSGCREERRPWGSMGRDVRLIILIVRMRWVFTVSRDRIVCSVKSEHMISSHSYS